MHSHPSNHYSAVALALLSTIAASTACAEIPDALKRYVWSDSPQALARVVGEIDSPDASPAVIEVTAPATAAIRFGKGEATFTPTMTVSQLPVGSDPEGDIPNDVEYHPNGNSYFVLHRWSRNIIRFDAATNTPIQTYSLSGQLPQAMDITPDGNRIIVAYFTEDQLGVINVSTGGETVIPTGNGPGVVEITPDGSRALIGCVIDSTLRVIDLASLTEERSISTPGYSQTLSFGSESGVVDLRFQLPFAFLGSSKIVFAGRFDPTPTVAFIDYLAGTRHDLTTGIGPSPAGVAVSGNGAVVAISHASAAGTTTILDPTTETIVRTIAGPGAFANGPIVLNSDGTRAVIAFQNAARWLNLTTDTFSAALGTANLEDLTVNAAGTRVVGIGFSGAIIDFATGTLIGTPNNIVSCTRGAVSPIADRAVLASWPCFGDDIVVLDTDTTPTRLFFGRSGNNPEGDCPRNAAVSPDGQIAVCSNVNSDNLSILDTHSGALLRFATLDQRPGEIEITPDNTKAVVCNLDGTTVSIVNLATGATTAVASATRLAQVEIDPTGTFAYLAQVANGDGVRKLNINTASFVGGITTTGDMGSVGYVYSQVSQIALSPDGSLLAVAGGFNDRLDIVNTSTMAVQQSFSPLGTFITRVSWSPDGNELLVSDRDGASVIVVRRPNSSSAFAVAGTITTGAQPFDTVKLPASNRAFVINFGSNPPSLGVLNTSTFVQTSTIPLTNYPTGMVLTADGTRLSVLCANEATTVGGGNFSRVVTGTLTTIDTASLAILETTLTNQASAMLVGDAAGTTLASPAVSSEILTVIRGGCAADFNGDSVLDFFDYLDFVDAFSNNDPSADFNNDDVIDFFDYLDFVDAFSTGC